MNAPRSAHIGKRKLKRFNSFRILN